MTRPLVPTNRFFVSSDFSLYYRRAKRVEWKNQVAADYSLLSIIRGELTSLLTDEPFKLSESQSLIIEPNVCIDATGKNLEFLFLTLSPALVMEKAIAMRLIAPQSTVTFKERTI